MLDQIRNDDNVNNENPARNVFVNQVNSVTEEECIDCKKNESEPETVKEKTIVLAKDIGTNYSYKHEIVWKNAIGFMILHSLAIYGFWLGFGRAQLRTWVWNCFVAFWASEGVTIGAHRLYTHKSFKANAFLRSILVILQTTAGQNCMYIWVRDHRQHHRYSDTDADPHNAMRGFFFSHIGWLMHRKHPLVKKYMKTINMSDLEADPFVMFQKNYYKTLYIIFAILIPVSVPIYFWNESAWTALLFCYFARYVFALNGTWLVNSAAHLYGTRPYDSNLLPVESWFVSLLSSGEGWHNYHHAFPWDYKCSEYGMHFNITATIIEFCAKIGLAYDLKAASDTMVENRIRRAGDGTHYALGNDESKSAVTVAFGTPLHPLNPSYNSKTSPMDIKLTTKGLPLVEEDLAPEERKLDMSSVISEVRRRIVVYGK